mmetsp:Transcript_17959/g.26912  ORF Transcript_17959/g.26912 Transcript_17959/m.26912 type:complete len:276 (-) Transcript_17959:131-958(-)
MDSFLESDKDSEGRIKELLSKLDELSYPGSSQYQAVRSSLQRDYEESLQTASRFDPDPPNYVQEIDEWTKRFPSISVRGRSIKMLGSDHKGIKNQTKKPKRGLRKTSFLKTQSSTSEVSSIMGRKMQISPELPKEEVILQDGVAVDELICFHSDSTHGFCEEEENYRRNGLDILTPNEAARSDLESKLFDILWRDVVHTVSVSAKQSALFKESKENSLSKRERRDLKRLKKRKDKVSVSRFPKIRGSVTSMEQDTYRIVKEEVAETPSLPPMPRR